MINNNSQPIINQLQADLLAARKARDTFTSKVLQTVIAAIDNAGAVPITEDTHAIGVGSTEMPRRELSAQDIQAIIEQEIAELQSAIQACNGVQSAYTNELGDKITLIKTYLQR